LSLVKSIIRESLKNLGNSEYLLMKSLSSGKSKTNVKECLMKCVSWSLVTMRSSIPTVIIPSGHDASTPFTDSTKEMEEKLSESK
jgi:hypothetical protein